MTQQKKDTGVGAILEIINEYGMDGLKEAVSILINEAMKVERSHVLNALPWERLENRGGYANGFKDKQVASRFGNLSLKIPQVRFQRNATAYVPKVSMRSEVARDIRTIFNAPDRSEAERFLGMAIEKYKDSASRLSEWLESNIPEGLTVFALPDNQRRKLRSTNMVERLNREINRRTRVAGLFPNEASLLRLVSSVLIETSEEGETGKRYLSMDR